MKYELMLKTVRLTLKWSLSNHLFFASLKSRYSACLRLTDTNVNLHPNDTPNTTL